MIRHLLVLALSCLLVTACGFHLRGPRPLPFASIYLAMDNYAELTVALKRQIRSTGTTRIAEKQEEAELILQVGRNDREKNILSLNAKGTVREYQLKQRFGFRLIGRDAFGQHAWRMIGDHKGRKEKFRRAARDGGYRFSRGNRPTVTAHGKFSANSPKRLCLAPLASRA